MPVRKTRYNLYLEAILMKRNILLMNLLVMALWMGVYAYVPTLQAYGISLGATAMTLGVIGGMYGAAQIVLRVPLGVLADKTGKSKLLMVVGALCCMASNIVFLCGSSVETLILGRLLAGVTAAFWVIASAMYANYHTEDRQVYAQGRLSAFSSIGKVGAALLCGVIAQMLSLWATFIPALIGSGMMLVCALLIKDNTTKKSPLPVSAFLSVFKNRQVIFCSVFSIVAQMVCFGAASTFSQVAAQEAGATGFELGMLIVVFFGATTLASFFVGSRLYRKMGGFSALILAFCIGLVACIPMFYRSGLWLIYLMQILSGISYGVTTSCHAGFVILAVKKEFRTAATGVYQSLYAVGITLGPLLAGALIEYISFDAAYFVFAGMMAASAVLTPILLDKKFNRA